MLATEEDCPGNTAGVLALEEERLGLSILKAEDLAVTADVELALHMYVSYGLYGIVVEWSWLQVGVLASIPRQRVQSLTLPGYMR